MGSRTIKNWKRTMRHKRYINEYLSNLRWESLNVMLMASRTAFTAEVVNLLDNNAKLIRKYERRLRLLRL